MDFWWWEECPEVAGMNLEQVAVVTWQALFWPHLPAESVSCDCASVEIYTGGVSGSPSGAQYGGRWVCGAASGSGSEAAMVG